MRTGSVQLRVEADGGKVGAAIEPMPLNHHSEALVTARLPAWLTSEESAHVTGWTICRRRRRPLVARSQHLGQPPMTRVPKHARGDRSLLRFPPVLIWVYRPSSASKAPVSSRARTCARNRPVSAVHGPVVVRQAQVHHVADGQDVVSVGNHDGAFDDGAHAEFSHLRLVDDGRVKECSHRTNVGNGEGASGELLSPDGTLARPARDVGNARGESGQIHVPGSTHHRYQLPRELFEAARIDGASYFGLFRRIALPLSIPSLIVIFIFEFQASCNNFQGALIYLNSGTPDGFTAPLGIAYAMTKYSPTNGGQGDYQFVMVAALLGTLPMLILFAFGQRYFIEGVATEGRKG